MLLRLFACCIPVRPNPRQGDSVMTAQGIGAVLTGTPRRGDSRTPISPPIGSGRRARRLRTLAVVAVLCCGSLQGARAQPPPPVTVSITGTVSNNDDPNQPPVAGALVRGWLTPNAGLPTRQNLAPKTLKDGVYPGNNPAAPGTLGPTRTPPANNAGVRTA